MIVFVLLFSMSLSLSFFSLRHISANSFFIPTLIVSLVESKGFLVLPPSLGFGLKAMSFSTWSFLALGLSMATIPHANAEGETSIWINEIPLYSSLAPCASDRISAIIRAQKSGCNDDSAHTSFACFCIDSSSQFSSIISTAVAQQCSGQASGEEIAADESPNVQASVVVIETALVPAEITGVPARRGAALIRQVAATPIGDVASALELFESYCAKATMLSKCKKLNPLTTTISRGSFN
jgi:hypothetical protein